MSKSRKLGMLALLLATVIGLEGTANAYSVKVHIHYVNLIRDNLLENWQKTGVPRLSLLQPNPQLNAGEGQRNLSASEKFVELRQEDAEAIRDYPEFFRAGSIGPDNTVFSGLTDPSHAWHFAPFSQCQALLDAAQTGEERAYALGCFTHGVADNAAHHVVNYFTGETFTLFPKDALEGGELAFSMLNVARHIVVEGKLEEAIAKTFPGAFAPEKMSHRIATNLVRRVYYQPGDGSHGLWHWFAGSLVARKNDALRAAQLEGFDPSDALEVTIEDLRENPVAIDLDGRVLNAYVNFLSSGGAVEALQPGGMAPYEYVLMLPEIIEDMKRLMQIALSRGEARYEALKAEWEGEGECSITCPQIRLRKELYEHLFDPSSNDGVSRMAIIVQHKNSELDQIMTAYLQTIEGLSNTLVSKQISSLTREDISKVLAPISDAIDQVSEIPWDALFPNWAVTVLNSVESLRSFLEGAYGMIKDQIKAQILHRIHAYMDIVREEIARLRDAALAHIDISIEALRDELHRTLDTQKLELLGLNVDSAADLLNNFGTSVLFMNTYNSIVGVLGNTNTVFPDFASGFFAGPVSFDASYQLHYNQMALCSDLREDFYPCGISSTEMLQPNYNSCIALTGVVAPNPNIECHRFDETAFLTNPDPEACSQAELDEIVSPFDGHVGSYTLAFPPEYASPPPECFNPSLVGINSDKFDDKSDDADGAGGDGEGGGLFGCRVASEKGKGGTGFPLAYVFLALCLVIRRRR